MFIITLILTIVIVINFIVIIIISFIPVAINTMISIIFSVRANLFLFSAVYRALISSNMLNLTIYYTRATWILELFLWLIFHRSTALFLGL